MSITTRSKNGANPTNDPGYFPGKPGPAPTGVKRKIQLLMMLTDEEYEFIRRKSSRREISAAAYLRRKIFPDNWKLILKRLREIQGGNVP